MGWNALIRSSIPMAAAAAVVVAVEEEEEQAVRPRRLSASELTSAPR
jgi:hypothetical protein